MSRVANNPVNLPSGVEITQSGQTLSIKGSKGSLSMDVHPAVEVKQEEGTLHFAALNSSKESRAMSGTTRALVNNMVVGVSAGFEKKLELQGVGYRASYPKEFQLKLQRLLKLSCAVLINKRLVTSLQKFAHSVRQSLIKARVFVMPVNKCVVKKPRRNR